MEHGNENIERLEALLAQKDFNDLSVEDRSFVVKELGSEEQYNAMRKISLALVMHRADLTPDPGTLPRLKDALKQRRNPADIFASLFLKPVPSFVVIILVFVSGLALVLAASRPPAQVGVTRVETHVLTDTVFLSVKPDTVIVQKVVYKYLPPRVSEPVKIVKALQPERDASPDGVNMKEKEELESFLVSGS
jgi:hypothetical protein